MDKDRADALYIYTCVKTAINNWKAEKQKLNAYMIAKVEDILKPVWSHLTVVEKEAVMFVITEHLRWDKKFIGSLGLLYIDTYVKKYITPDVAARFILKQDDRLN